MDEEIERLKNDLQTMETQQRNNKSESEILNYL